MSASNSQGIQTLLEAERKAQEIVQEARAFRTQRVKASKTDAAKEVEEYKAKKEEEFQKTTSAKKQTEEQSESIAASESKGQIDDLQKLSASKRQDVIKFLVDQATASSA